MPRKITLLILLQLLFIVVLFAMLVLYGKDEFAATQTGGSDNLQHPDRVSKNKDASVVSVSLAAQQKSGFQFTKLVDIQHHNTLKGHARVFAINTLIESRLRYLSARSELEVLQATWLAKKNEYQRLQILNADDKNIADKALEAAHAELLTVEARITAASLQMANIADTLRLNWGNALSQLAMQRETPALLERIIRHETALLLVTFPLDSPPINRKITLIPNGFNHIRFSGDYLGIAPTSTNLMTGKTYFYTVASSYLRPDMRLQVESILTHTSPQKGVYVPNSAVLWYGGRAWVYRRINPTSFERLSVEANLPALDGWFEQGHLQAGQVLVTSSAQLLLSEEFKAQISNENQD